MKVGSNRELFKDEVAQFLLNRVYLHMQRPCLKAEHQIKWTPGVIRPYIYILYTEKLNKIIYFFALVCVQHYIRPLTCFILTTTLWGGYYFSGLQIEEENDVPGDRVVDPRAQKLVSGGGRI